MVAAFEASQVRILLASLPDGQRRLLLLRVVAGFSAEDTGYVLDMSPGAVRVAQHRTLLRLRALATAGPASEPVPGPASEPVPGPASEPVPGPAPIQGTTEASRVGSQ
jgi:hypothetical protein